jgi:23S rRNA pseudouridine2605 synthase
MNSSKEMTGELVRLQKFLAECGVASRREAEELITSGRVHVNGAVVNKLGSKINPASDRVTCNRRIVKPLIKGVVLYHKPRELISTLKDPQGRRCLGDVFGSTLTGYFPVGRLDWDSSGLLLMTNDGELTNRLLHPRYEFNRRYSVRVEGKISEEALLSLSKGVKLKDGMAHAFDVEVLKSDSKSSWIELTVKEGRNHLIRRVFDKLGFPVIKLKRLSHGPFSLGNLQSGRFRALTDSEYQKVKRKIFAK